jgi:hypothetical protein
VIGLGRATQCVKGQRAAARGRGGMIMTRPSYGLTLDPLDVNLGGGGRERVKRGERKRE